MSGRKLLDPTTYVKIIILRFVSAFILKSHENCFGILLRLSCEENEYKNIFALIFYPV